MDEYDGTLVISLDRIEIRDICSTDIRPPTRICIYLTMPDIINSARILHKKELDLAANRSNMIKLKLKKAIAKMLEKNNMNKHNLHAQ